MERDKQTPDLNLVFFLVRRSPLRVSPLVQVSDTFGLDRSTSERKQETSRWSSSRFVINISLGTPSEGNRSGRIKENGFPRMETERSFSLSLSLFLSAPRCIHSHRGGSSHAFFTITPSRSTALHPLQFFATNCPSEEQFHPHPCAQNVRAPTLAGMNTWPRIFACQPLSTLLAILFFLPSTPDR